MEIDVVKRAAELITNADSLIIAAGAGMGVNSGPPDFRSKAVIDFPFSNTLKVELLSRP